MIVDANVIIRSSRLNSGAWRAALHARDKGSLDLVVPEVALLEAVAWFEREVPERVRRYQKQASLLGQVGILLEDHGVAGAGVADRLAKEVAEGYGAYLRERVGASAIYPLPEIDHRSLIERATRRVKPFNESGSGYRDALIWESVCDLAANRSVAFVSDNTKDFADGDGVLASDLARDLESRGMASSSVQLFTDLLDVVKLYAPEATDARARVEAVMATAGVIDQLEAEFGRTFATYEGIPLPAGTPGLHSLMRDATVEAVWELTDIRVVNVKPIGDATYLVVGTARAIARAYSVRQEADYRDLDAAREAVDAGLVSEWSNVVRTSSC